MNLQKVTEATDGRVAYVYVPNTSTSGHEYFKRYFFPQAHKDAIIIDERHNSGGSIADYYIDLMKRPMVALWATRYGADIKTPIASITSGFSTGGCRSPRRRSRNSFSSALVAGWRGTVRVARDHVP